MDTVAFFDTETKRVIRIPASELRPGCIQAKVEGIDEVVWMSPEQLKLGEIRHPPFDEELLEPIRDIQQTFAEHRNLTVEEWADGFRRDANPEREIAIFWYAGEVYRLFAAAEPSAERRRDIYRLLITCMTTSPNSVWHVAKPQALTQPEAERIVKRFYGGDKADTPGSE